MPLLLDGRAGIRTIEVVVGGRACATRHHRHLLLLLLLHAGGRRALSPREVVRLALGCLGRRSRKLHAGRLEALDSGSG